MRVFVCGSIHDRQNKERSVPVQAVTAYKAACRAWSKFKLGDD
jgi:hypothetical protein